MATRLADNPNCHFGPLDIQYVLISAIPQDIIQHSVVVILEIGIEASPPEFSDEFHAQVQLTRTI